MSFSLVLCWSVVRAIVVSAIAIGLFLPLRNRLFQSRPTTSLARWTSILAVAPLLMPDLLLGFTYRLASAGLDFSEVKTETLYACLLLTKGFAIQVICHWLLPASNVSKSAIHLWKVSIQTSFTSRLLLLRMILSGPHRSVVVGWILSVLWCFQEFETAALLQIEQHPIAWTVWLFDAKAANEPLMNCVLFALPAIIIQGLLIATSVALLGGRKLLSGEITKPDEHDAISSPSNQSTSFGLHSFSIIVIAAGFLLTVVWPIVLHGAAGINGLWQLSTTAAFQVGLKQISLSLLVAALSAVASWTLSRCLFATRYNRLALLTILPGLLSPLVLSLLLLGLFLSPGFHVVYDSWIPLIAAQTLWLLPRAFLLNIVVQRTIRSEQIHSAKLLSRSTDRLTQREAKRLNWILEYRPAWLSITVLIVMAFWEVTINSILHPVSLQPMVCRLYREMHFGHTEVLAGLTAMSIVFPLLALAIGAQIWKLVRQ